MSMTCPHCEEDVNDVTRTGDKRYSCGECNMVISYDDLEPHLDDLNVKDKRGDGGSEEPTADDMVGDLPAPPGAGEGGGQQQQSSGSAQQNSTPDMNTSHEGINEREKIYQRGTEGLKQIKKERLKNWLANTDGVGSQTEQRILMVFERNESVHKNPHVLYNLLDDELSASASYINTMVQDIFAPEEEHGDLLQQQGYTPWYNRGAPQGGNQQQGGFGRPMNATGSNRFNPNQQGQQQGQQEQQSQSPGEDSISRGEAEMMMRQAMDQANQNNQRGALMDGLSDATDEAVREMASNVGGLAGTIHRVVDEALVQYARDNPEWVIENMGVLQKVLGAAEDMPGDGGSDEPEQAEQDSRVDDALASIGGGGNSPSGGGGQQQQNQTQQSQAQSQEPQTESSNPDLTEDHLQDSAFDPDMGSSSGMSASPDEPLEQDDTQPEPKPTPGEEEAQIAEQKREQFESEEPSQGSSGSDNGSADEGFDEIFGDMTAE